MAATTPRSWWRAIPGKPRHVAAHESLFGRPKDSEGAFALLEYQGAESAGSLTLLPTGVDLPEQRALRPLSVERLNKRIEDLPRAPLQKEAPKRMSVASAQHKLLVVLKEDNKTADSDPGSRPDCCGRSGRSRTRGALRAARPS
jgi:hypothetical protein